MKRQCCNCHKDLGTKPGDPNAVTHAYCSVCLRELEHEIELHRLAKLRSIPNLNLVPVHKAA